jgi:hypothetical protein
MISIPGKIRFKIGLDGLALIIVMAGIIWTNLHYKFWNDEHRIIVYDVIQYYEYLPAAVIYKDLSLSFKDKEFRFFKDKIWAEQTKTGRYVSRMTMGLAVLYSPFFLAAHAMAGPSGYPEDGYSYPYRLALVISSIVYAGIGFIFLVKLLRKYFARSAAAITILAIGLGTNLYFYTTNEPTMSHAYSFCLFAVFIFLVDAWTGRPSWGNSIAIGLIGGLIILVRPPNGIIFLLLPLWHVDSFQALMDRFKLFIRKIPQTAAIAIFTCLVFLPQIFYWKYATGEYFYNGYGNQGVFYFNHPVFFKGLFSYRKGWLIYTPIMAFSLIGIVVLYFRHRKFFWPVAVFTVINLYIVWSWWCWWYGGGFGQRALIESYALLSVPFAACSQLILKSKIIFRLIYLTIITALISLNIFQSYQYYVGIIHWDAMSKKAYWDSYIRFEKSILHERHLDPPDYDAALKGKR